MEKFGINDILNAKSKAVVEAGAVDKYTDMENGDKTKIGHKEKCSDCSRKEKPYFCMACTEYYEKDYTRKPHKSQYAKN